MPLTDRFDTADGGKARNRKLHLPKTHKGSKGSKGHGRGHKPPKPKTVHPARWHEAASHPAGADTRASTGSLGTPHLAGSGLPAWLLRPGTAMAAGMDRLPGITGVLLDLVGEGSVGLHAALASWQSEQTRLTNRAWRRPGGLARMGSL